jgi:hypothetical protein
MTRDSGATLLPKRPRRRTRPIRRGLSDSAREYSYELLEQRAGYKMWAYNGIEWVTDGHGNFIASVPVRSMIRFTEQGKADDASMKPLLPENRGIHEQ